ncbi:tRNA pseudouridine synthase 3 [Mycena indigotica]|uniref:tRNA pseudouridine synthase 3 n=1 Tax=Mycena indigotica TaxID=2126181 RepID=A0A8H6SEA8_9AGAR|nr:tRNA pseudouridine synthase 3 [Mycena indigotica]KAF7297195.1 tRNA pseudouridine synthase 3 [Mycena indigotica]
MNACLRTNIRAMASSTYESWSKHDLIAKLIQLEAAAQPVASTSTSTANSRRPWREFDFSAYPRRKIALKFCYSGWEYNGLAIQADVTPLPTVEGVLFDALSKARLIDGEAGMEGCEWERCGRTDRGVSAAGQVVSLWVRSALNTNNTEKPKPVVSEEELDLDTDDTTFPTLSASDFGTLDGPVSPATHNRPRKRNKEPDPNRQEHNFPAILNRLLPPTIRVLAWSPVAPSFSSRFACTSRHYKYFFSPSLDGLDVSKMQAAANYLIGSHDFRNFCKIDPAKQLTEYRRHITRADISGTDSNGMHVFDLIGSAFLYHQVRHIMAILFLVGAGLEKPSIVPTLLNVTSNAEKVIGEAELPVLDTKPEYQMADGLPLMLYACHYPEGLLDWQTDTVKPAAQKYDSSADADAFAQLQYALARSEMYSTLNNAFSDAAQEHHYPETSNSTTTTYTIPLGGATFRRSSKYVPLLLRNRNKHFEVVNERWRVGKGARKKAVQDKINGSERWSLPV